MKMMNDMELEMAAGGTKTNGEVLYEGVTNAVEENQPIIDVVVDGAKTVWSILEYVYNK